MTLDEISSVLGLVDSSLVAEINRTGASAAELAEAWA